MNTRELGKRAEQYAADFARRQGWSIRDQNWSCAEGELDIVADDGTQCIFIEVKGRRSNQFGTPEESVGRRKQRHLRDAAWRYLIEHGLEQEAWRIDVIAIEMDSRGRIVRFDHYPYAVSGEAGECASC
ncbi:MAG: YraN family protein [Anaerolineales bacterium]|nr:YraN family protein [Anaerolineales bacterium]